jgi:hypothetical protein
MISRLRYERVDGGKDRRGRKRVNLRPFTMDPGRAHAVIAALKLRLEIFDRHQVGEKLTEQSEALLQLTAEIDRLKKLRGVES